MRDHSPQKSFTTETQRAQRFLVSSHRCVPRASAVNFDSPSKIIHHPSASLRAGCDIEDAKVYFHSSLLCDLCVWVVRSHPFPDPRIYWVRLHLKILLCDLCVSVVNLDSYNFFFPGRPAGFSCVRSRKCAFMPVALETACSPNFSRIPSAAESAGFHFSCVVLPFRLSCSLSSAKCEAHTPSRRAASPFQFARKSSRIVASTSESTELGCSRVRARVRVRKSE